MVHLTDAGRALRGPVTEMWRSLERLAARDLTPEQIEAFTRSARVITRSFREQDRQAPAG